MNQLIEKILLSTYNISFGWEIRKLFLYTQSKVLFDFINLTQVHNFTVSAQDIFTFHWPSVFTVHIFLCIYGKFHLSKEAFASKGYPLRTYLYSRNPSVFYSKPTLKRHQHWEHNQWYCLDEERCSHMVMHWLSKYFFYLLEVDWKKNKSWVKSSVFPDTATVLCHA